MKWKDLSLKERKQIYDSVRVNNPDATYFDIKEQFDSIPTYEDGKGKTINKADLPPEYRTGTPEYSDLDNNTFYNLCKAVYRNAAKWKH